MPPCVSADRDGDGHIEAKELGTVMRIMGMEPTSEQLQSLVESIDIDGNGKIELEEFANMMARQMLLRDGKVGRASSSPHLTSPTSPSGGGAPFRAYPWDAVALCCAARGTLAPVAWLEGRRVLAAWTRTVAACDAQGRSPDPLGAVAGSGGRSGGRSAAAAPDRAAVMVVLRWLGVGHGLAQYQG
jgi:hypothetical protein|tara:strand:- start:28 stop:585 length:558 start_codon:yes stop_codon:yes gene_type:complete